MCEHPGYGRTNVPTNKHSDLLSVVIYLDLFEHYHGNVFQSSNAC